MSVKGLGPAELFKLARSGDRRSIGRLLTLVERGGPTSDEITELTHRASGEAHVIGITGAPGAGKSTLTGQLTVGLAAQGPQPAVLAVDPSSPLTGGAILGDRIRMDSVAGQDSFIRSMATRGQSGGLALAVPGAIRVFDACGFDPIIIETVGVGQVEVDIARAADTTLVVVTPGWGDAVQANKAGLLELADVFVVNKADRPGANDARRDLELMLDFSHMTGQEDKSGYRPPIVMATALKGIGISEVAEAIALHRSHLSDSGQLEARRTRRIEAEITGRVSQMLSAEIESALASSEGRALVVDAQDRKISPGEAAHAIVASLAEHPPK